MRNVYSNYLIKRSDVLTVFWLEKGLRSFEAALPGNFIHGTFLCLKKV